MIDKYFTNTVSRIEWYHIKDIENDVRITITAKHLIRLDLETDLTLDSEGDAQI